MGHFTLLVPKTEDTNATLLLAQASAAVQENPDMADVMEYRITVGEIRYSLADVIKLLTTLPETNEIVSTEQTSTSAAADTTDCCVLNVIASAEPVLSDSMDVDEDKDNEFTETEGRQHK